MKHQQQPLAIVALLISTALLCGCAEPWMPSLSETADCCAYEPSCYQAPDPVIQEGNDTAEVTNLLAIQEAGSGLR